MQADLPISLFSPISKMIKAFFCLVIVSTVSALACETNLPFSPSIVGRNQSIILPCAPPKYFSYTRVSVNASDIRHIPLFVVNAKNVCVLQYIFKIRKRKPLLIVLLRLVAPDKSGPINYNEYCQREQRKQKMILRPVGPTRARFTSDVKAMITGITFLRDHGCRPQPHLRYIYEEEYLNPWLDGPITYLRGVAFNYGICLD